MKYLKLFAFAVLSSVVFVSPAKAQDIVYVGPDPVYYVPTRSSAFTLYDSDSGNSVCQFVVGYVNKSWICTYSTGTQREDFFGDPNDKFLHGFQMGALFTPTFQSGFGARTGLFFEGYTSRSKWITYFCNHFSEADLYIPLHASYDIDFGNDCGIYLYGGIGFQWAMSGRYYRQVGTVWKYWWRRPVPVFEGKKHQYGYGWPEQVNWQAELGLNFHFKRFGLGFTYSFGIKNHGIENSFDDGATYVKSSKSRQDKMQASIYFLL